MAQQVQAHGAGANRPQDLQGPNNSQLPLTRDWTPYFLTPIKDQKTSTACWAFSIAVSAEGKVNELELGTKGPGYERTMLTDYFIEKVTIPTAKGLANIRKAYKHLEKNGIQCKMGLRPRANLETLSVPKYIAPEDPQKLPVVNERQLIAIVARRPVCVYLPVGKTFDTLKRGTIYGGLGAEEKIGDHSVAVVGYDTIRGVHIWWIRNSWGTDWADGGYAMVRRAISRGGVSVFTGVHYPLIDRVERFGT